MVLEEQERRLPVVVEAALEVLEALGDRIWRAVQGATQDQVLVAVYPRSNRVENGLGGLHVEAEDQGLLTAQPGPEGSLGRDGHLRVLVAGFHSSGFVDKPHIGRRSRRATRHEVYQHRVAKVVVGAPEVGPDGRASPPAGVFLHSAHHQVMHELRVARDVEARPPAECAS